jgi:hypothetical protein
LLPAWVPRPDEGGLLDTLFAWRERLSVSEHRLLAALLFAVAAGLAAATLRWPRLWLRNLAVLAAGLWLALAASAALVGRSPASQPAVVTVSEVVARAADSANAPPQLSEPLPGGTEVELVERRDLWNRIRLADGRETWVPASAVERVAGR